MATSPFHWTGPHCSRPWYKLERDDVEAVAVCYLHSYRNPNHEELTRRAILRALPESLRFTLLGDSPPDQGKYERFSTTVVNARVGPLLSRYLDRLSAQLRGAGYQGRLLIMQSQVVWPRLKRQRAWRRARALRAGGRGGRMPPLRTTAGRGPVIAFDMGGTSTDISLITVGEGEQETRRAPSSHRGPPGDAAQSRHCELGRGRRFHRVVDAAESCGVGPAEARAPIPDRPATAREERRQP